MKSGKLIVFFAGLALFLSQPTVAQPSAYLKPAGAQAFAPEWQRYKIDGEEFSVLFPITPAMNTISTWYARDKARRERILGAYADGVVYLIHTVEKKGISLDQF